MFLQFCIVLDALSADDISRVIDSLSDNYAYLSYNVRPVESTIHLLTSYFSDKKPSNAAFDLSLSPHYRGLSFSSLYSRSSSSYSSSGATLSHDHSTQFVFVLQTLTLWKEIMSNMPRLWCMADDDMISQPYRLANTGQGYHRLQSCPQVRSVMSKILSKVQKQVLSFTVVSSRRLMVWYHVCLVR